MGTETDLGVCRWALECEAPAVEVIAAQLKTSTWAPTPACAEHADDYHSYTRIDALYSRERDPECYCPDRPRAKAPYCPRHGNDDERGIDPFAKNADRT